MHQKSSSLAIKHAKVLTTGSREYKDYASVGRAISLLINKLMELGYKEITFMHGGCRGADSHVVEFINKTENSILKLTGVKVRHEVYLPNIQDQEMVDQNPVHALVFLQRGESNSGTLSTVRRLIKGNIPFTAYGAVELLDKLA